MELICTGRPLDKRAVAVNVLPSLLGLPPSVFHAVGEECGVSQEEPGVMWRNLFASFANPLTCSVQWNPLNKGFSGYRTITPSQYLHLPTFLMSHGSGSVIERLDVPEKLSKSCAIVRFHIHRVMSCESRCFPEQQGSAALSLSVTNI